MSVNARFFPGLILAMFAQTFVLQCYANEPGWRVTQLDEMCGKSIGYISPSGAKFVYKNQGYTFVTGAPEWKAVIYNEKSKIYFKTTIKNYLEELSRSTVVSGIHDVDPTLWVKAGPCMLEGRRCVKYVYHAKKPNAAVKTAECWFCEEIPDSPQVSEFIARLDLIPPLRCLPLRLVHHFVEGDSGHVVIRTFSCEKIAIPSDCYSYPKDFRLASNIMQVAMGDLGKEMIEQVLK
jgi:hypothetical protein